MVNRNKTIIMTKMALYDKYHGNHDRAVSEYFRHDYIYRKNAWTRFFVLIGGIFLLVGYWARKIIDEGLDILNMDYKQIGADCLLFLFVILVLYTFVGTIRAAIDYSECQKRIHKYSQMINRLERIQPKAEEYPEEDSDLYYGTDFVNQRNER